jgi:hypothetical protein
MKYVSLTMGCDPEFFISKEGKIIGSEHVVPKEGLLHKQVWESSKERYVDGAPQVIQDGVQVELNPMADTCRQRISGSIHNGIMTVVSALKDGMSISPEVTVEVTEDELNTLHPKNRVLGCNPSFSIYESEYELGVDPATYMIRSGGGHLHFGVAGYDRKTLKDIDPAKYSASCKDAYVMFNNPKDFIKVLDIVVGNTCVLFDRDKGNKIRREVYGKAGEYRTPNHGVEYRTLSNFWLRDYSVMSLVFALGRAAYTVALNDNLKDLLEVVDMADVQKAINKNDAKLARKNFDKVYPVLVRLFDAYGYPDMCPINPSTKDAFEFFVEKGMDFFFSKDIVSNWQRNYGSAGFGDERFFKEIVPTKMQA